MKEQEIKRGGIYQRGIMYRHQLSYCSRLQQRHNSQTNSACTLDTHARTEQGDNTPPTVLLYDVSIHFLSFN